MRGVHPNDLRRGKGGDGLRAYIGINRQKHLSSEIKSVVMRSKDSTGIPPSGEISPHFQGSGGLGPLCSGASPCVGSSLRRPIARQACQSFKTAVPAHGRRISPLRLQDFALLVITWRLVELAWPASCLHPLTRCCLSMYAVLSVRF